MIQEFEKVMALSIEEIQRHPSLIINAFDKQHTIILWNDRCAQHFGIPVAAAVGNKLEVILPWVTKDEKLAYIDRALMGINFHVLKTPYKLKMGFYEQRIIPIKDEGGNILAALNIVEDLNT